MKHTRKVSGGEQVRRTRKREMSDKQKPSGGKRNAKAKSRRIMAEGAPAWCGYRPGILRDHKGV